MVCQLIETFICLERIEWRKYNVNDYDRLRFCLMMSWWTRVHSSLSLYGPWYGRGGQRCSCQYENCDVTWPVSHCWPAGVGRHGAGHVSRVTLVSSSHVPCICGWMCSAPRAGGHWPGPGGGGQCRCGTWSPPLPHTVTCQDSYSQIYEFTGFPATFGQQ